MSLGLLLDKYDVSTEEGLQKALSEIEKEELEVDSALSGALSKACNIEGRLRSASQAYSKLGEVQTDTLAASEMVEKTAALARDVSAKVRQLDLARSRVAECQRRVHDLIDLQLCSAGVEAAIKAHDYETGAAHVSRFLLMDPGSVAAARARGDADPRRHMARAADTLRDQLVAKFEEAARKEDAACVERLYKLFPQIGRAEEGVQLYAKYLANQLESKIRVAAMVQAGAAEEAVFADALTRVLEAGAAAAGALLATQHVAPFALLQHKICNGGRAVCMARSARRAGMEQPREPRALEPQLAELALMHARLKMYFNFLRRRTQSVAESLKEEEKKKATEEMEKIIAECELTRIAQDILEQYLSLERYFLEESVSKALKLSTPQVGTTSSSLVDDVFYIARKVIRRALSTGSVDGACCVLNEAASVLERDVAGALRRRLRAPPPDPLPFPGPRATRTDQGLLAQRLNRDLEAQRELYLAHMCEAEAGAEWAERLAAEACVAAQPILSNHTERAKLESCAVGVGAATAAFRAAHALALAALRAALQHTVTHWAQRLADPNLDPDEMEEDSDQLPRALETLLEAARAGCSAATADALLSALVADLTKQAEQRMLENHYDRESGIAVERRARRLAAWSGGALAGARERCARLAAGAALLAADTQHAPPPPRLPPALVRDLLARRTDFKIEDIKRLKI